MIAHADVFNQLREHSAATRLVAEFLRDEPIIFYMRLLMHFGHEQQQTRSALRGMISLLSRTLLSESDQWDEMNAALFHLHVERLPESNTSFNGVPL